MKKSVVAMCSLLFGAVQQSTAANVEATMYLDMEMPCLKSEMLSGRIVIRNHGDDDIMLLKREPYWPNMLVDEQLYLFPDISVQEARVFYPGPEHGLEGEPSRSRIKHVVGSCIQENRDHITLKKGETFEVNFAGRKIEPPAFNFHNPRKRIPFKIELYLSPDTWIPVAVHPPIAIAYDAKYTPLTGLEKGGVLDGNAARVTRVQIGPNEFLWAKAEFATSSQRLADLHPDDVVTHSNKMITITQKDGKVRTIPEADIARVSAERAEEKRKARQQKGEN